MTQRDVAERAGVSTAVVSYVINNGPRPTSTDVRARVLESSGVRLEWEIKRVAKFGEASAVEPFLGRE